MNPDKSKIKIGTAQEIGEQLDDQLEGAERQIHLQDGAAMGLRRAAEKLKELGAHVQKDLKEGHLGEFGDLGLKVADYAIRYISRSASLVENLALTAEVEKVKAIGRVDGLKAAVQSTKKVMDGEKVKLLAYEQAVRDGDVNEDGEFEGDPEDRPEGTHPGRPLAARKSAAADIERRRKESKGAPPSSKTKAATPKAAKA